MEKFIRHKFPHSDTEYMLLTKENYNTLPDYMQNNGIKRLLVTYINDTGWNEIFLPDMKAFSFLDELRIHWTNINDLSNIHSCINISTLILDNGDKTEVRFEKFKNLKSFLSWDRKGIENVWSIKDLENLTVAGLKKNQFKDGIALNSLTKLRILKSAVEDLSFLSKAMNLTYLELSPMSKLSNIDFIANLTQLKYLLIEANKILSFNVINKLSNLEYCYLISKNASATAGDFIHLKNIKGFGISGNEQLLILNRKLDKIFNLNKWQ